MTLQEQISAFFVTFNDAHVRSVADAVSDLNANGTSLVNDSEIDS